MCARKVEVNVEVANAYLTITCVIITEIVWTVPMKNLVVCKLYLFNYTTTTYKHYYYIIENVLIIYLIMIFPSSLSRIVCSE